MQDDYVLVYRCLESVLTSKTRVEPDLYIMANGHVNCTNDTANITAIPSTVQHIPVNFPIKNVSSVHEYSGVQIPVEYATDYSNPNHINDINERGYQTIDGCAEFGDHHLLSDNAGLPLRNPNNYVNHPSGVPVDTNGYITNGNMRIPPEGMESTVAIVPQ